MSDPLNLTVETRDFPADDQVILIIIPISTGTVDQAVAAIRGNVASERNDLGKLSDALDVSVADLTRRIDSDAFLFALIL